MEIPCSTINEKFIQCNRWVLIPKRDFEDNYISKIRSECTLEEKKFIMIGKKKGQSAYNTIIHNNWKEDSDYLYVPRYYGMRWAFNNKIKVINSTQPNPFDSKLKNPFGKCLIKPIEELEQPKAIEKAHAALLQYGSCYIGSPPGQGKTEMSLYIISEHLNVVKGPVLVVLHAVEAIKQWKQVVVKYFPDLKESDFGIMHQNQLQYKDKKIVFTTLHSVLSRHEDLKVYHEQKKLLKASEPKSKKKRNPKVKPKPWPKEKEATAPTKAVKKTAKPKKPALKKPKVLWTQEMFNMFHCTIIDEAHTEGATEFSKMISTIISPLTICLSGTPTRDDRNDRILGQWVGPVTFQCKKYYTIQPIVKPTFLFVESGVEPLEMTKNHQKESLFSIYNRKLSFYVERNEAMWSFMKKDILERIKSKENWSFLGLGGRIPHLKYFRTRIQNEFPSLKVGIYVGKQSYKQYELPVITYETIGDYDILLSTFGTFGKAVNVPRLKFLWFLEPVRKITQAVNRIFRGIDYSENPIPGRVRDFVDDHGLSTISPLWNRWEKSRFLYYKKEKFYFEYSDKLLQHLNLPKPDPYIGGKWVVMEHNFVDVEEDIDDSDGDEENEGSNSEEESAKDLKIPIQKKAKIDQYFVAKPLNIFPLSF